MFTSELYSMTSSLYMYYTWQKSKEMHSDCDCLRALCPPGWQPEWHCGVRVDSNKKLVGFISAVPALVKIYDM